MSEKQHPPHESAESSCFSQLRLDSITVGQLPQGCCCTTHQLGWALHCCCCQQLLQRCDAARLGKGLADLIIGCDLHIPRLCKQSSKSCVITYACRCAVSVSNHTMLLPQQEFQQCIQPTATKLNGCSLCNTPTAAATKSTMRKCCTLQATAMR
jgi:hypothetical protein